VNAVGYTLLRSGRGPAAALAFRLNTRIFPRSANSFDSLGECYERLGLPAAAREQYRAALALAPGFRSAEQALHRIGASSSTHTGAAPVGFTLGRNMPVYLLIIWTVVLMGLGTITYLAAGGRAIFGTREQPERILGRRCQLYLLESGPKGLDPEQPRLPPAVIEEFESDKKYVLRFEEPVEWLGVVETRAHVSARHVGYPVSLTSGWWPRAVAVNGRFGSGEDFICFFKLLPRTRI
jgi:tetratricopeptide (TPR) repeat protein